MEIPKGYSLYMPTEIQFGRDTEDTAGELVRKYGGHNVLIVTDKGDFIKKSGIYERVCRSLEKAGLDYTEFSGVLPNPRLSHVYEGLQVMKERGADFLLAVGGGSTIDTAKAMGLGMCYSGDVWDFYCRRAVPKEIGPVGVISTIAGSGSETSCGTVIYDDVRSKVKTGCMAPFIRPRFCILDPEITFTLPAFQTGAGATDIFAHAFDTYLTDQYSYLGDRFCAGAMRTAVKYGPVAVREPQNYLARAELMSAASFAQNDICRIGRPRLPMTGGSHNLERMSGLFDTTHGAGLAVMLPAFVESLIRRDSSSLPRLAQLAEDVFDAQPAEESLADTAWTGLRRMREWLREMKMPASLHELLRREVTDADIDQLVSAAWYTDGNAMRAFGRSSREDVRMMYESVR